MPTRMGNDRFLTYLRTSTGDLRLGFRSSRGLDRGAHRHHSRVGTPRDKSPVGHWNIYMFRAIWSPAMQLHFCASAYPHHPYTVVLSHMRPRDAAR
jgi:hypothetical protein